MIMAKRVQCWAFARPKGWRRVETGNDSAQRYFCQPVSSQQLSCSGYES